MQPPNFRIPFIFLPPTLPAPAGPLQAKIGSVWDKAAEGYVGNNQGGGGAENGSSASPAAGTAPPVTLGMSVGHKLAARIVVNLSNKVGRACRYFGCCFWGRVTWRGWRATYCVRFSVASPPSGVGMGLLPFSRSGWGFRLRCCRLSLPLALALSQPLSQSLRRGHLLTHRVS